MPSDTISMIWMRASCTQLRYSWYGSCPNIYHGILHSITLPDHPEPQVWETYPTSLFSGHSWWVLLDMLTMFLLLHGQSRFLRDPHFHLQTAWVATYTKGKVANCWNKFGNGTHCGIGHACGHNLIAIAGVRHWRVPSEISGKVRHWGQDCVAWYTSCIFIGFRSTLLERIWWRFMVYSGRRRQRERCPSQQGRLRWDGHLSHVGSCLHLWFRQTSNLFKVSSCSGTPLIRSLSSSLALQRTEESISDTRKTFCSNPPHTIIAYVYNTLVHTQPYLHGKAECPWRCSPCVHQHFPSSSTGKTFSSDSCVFHGKIGPK